MNQPRVLIPNSAEPPLMTWEGGRPAYRADGSGPQPEPVGQGHIKIFDLKDDEQRQEAEKILTRAANGSAQISEKKININGDKYEMLLIWADMYLIDPKDRRKFNLEYNNERS